MQHLQLHLLRQRGGEPLDVQLLRVQPHGLHEELVALLIREADHLGLDGGAVPGPYPLDGAIVQGGAVQIGPNDVVGALVGVGQPADRPVLRRALCLEGEGQPLLIPRLPLHAGEVHTAGIDSGGRARLEAADGQAQPRQARCQGDGGSQAVRTGVPDHLPHDGASP